MLEKVDASLLRDVRSMGYQDLTLYAKNTAFLLGWASTSSGVGMVTYVSLTSLSFKAILTGTATAAELSFGAAAGIATGGGLLALAMISFGAWSFFKSRRAYGDQHSKEMKDE